MSNVKSTIRSQFNVLETVDSIGIEVIGGTGTKIINCRTEELGIGIKISETKDASIESHISFNDMISLSAYKNEQMYVNKFLALRNTRTSSDDLSKGFVIHENTDFVMRNIASMGHDIGFELIANDNLIIEDYVFLSQNIFIVLHRIENLRLILQSIGSYNVDIVKIRRILKLVQSEVIKIKLEKSILIGVILYLRNIDLNIIRDIIGREFKDLIYQVDAMLYELRLTIYELVL